MNARHSFVYRKVFEDIHSDVYFFARNFFTEVIMKKIKSFLGSFSKAEIILWCCSAAFISVSFLVFDRENVLTLVASLLGVTSLIFNAKGNPIGQLIMVIFSILYGIISFSFAYYGEMITYLGMTLPMSVFALVSWLKNPYEGKKSEVAVNRISAKEFVLAGAITAFVTFVFYFILKALATANLFPSTVSVATSFIAVYLCARRSPYFALGYAANDVVLIILWTLAAFEDVSYVSVVICFCVFFVNDMYGFFNWRKMEKNQRCGLLQN